MPVAGRSLYVQERVGDGPLLLFLHGFPSSSFDFAPLLEQLPGRRALLFDCLGFGLSDKPADHVYTLGWQADAAEALVARAGGGPVVLVAHDMGTSVATELFARDLRGEGSIEIEAALLINGSILLERASPTPGQKLLRSRFGPLVARATTATGFRLQFARVFSKAHPLTREAAADHWTLIATHDGHRIAHRTIHYMGERERLVDRWHGAIRDWPGELSFAWGLEDPVATTNVLDGLRALRPQAPVTELPGLGHYPQIEDPAAVAVAVEALLAG
ncbi:MAG: alpha/beta hydrolase [Solirubrobacterales bacterium]|nr:alpha/beta hydrolase [Solirubrobacterales bacterium]